MSKRRRRSLEEALAPAVARGESAPTAAVLEAAMRVGNFRKLLVVIGAVLDGSTTAQAAELAEVHDNTAANRCREAGVVS